MYDEYGEDAIHCFFLNDSEGFISVPIHEAA